MHEATVRPAEPLSSRCCAFALRERIVHTLDYDPTDSTSIVSTYRVSSCSACGCDTERVLVEQRRGMEERLPIDPEVITPPAFLRRLPWRLVA